MKKLLVALLVIAAVGFGAVAQAAAPAAPTVAWSGYVSTGLTVGSDDSIVFKNLPNSGKTFRARITGVVADGNFGARFRFQETSFTGLDLTQSLVYGTFFNNMLKFKLGLLDDYTWATYWNAYGTFDGQKGAQLILMPVTGLSLGAFVPFTDVSSTASAAFKAADLGMAYSMDKLFDMVAGGSFFGATQSAYVGVDVTAIDKLGFHVEANFADLSTIAPVVDGDFSYDLAPLTVGLHTTDTLASTIAWMVDPYVSYALNDKVTVGGDFSYDNTNAYTATGYGTFTLSGNTTAKASAWYDGTNVFGNFSYDVSF
ncbi:MAG TPA: hypothetical protein VMV44_13525 [Rectinemataceae bacterium]|nr:hypothetical protein [Rectinemataceae bacterium]